MTCLSAFDQPAADHPAARILSHHLYLHSSITLSESCFFLCDAQSVDTRITRVSLIKTPSSVWSNWCAFSSIPRVENCQAKSHFQLVKIESQFFSWIPTLYHRIKLIMTIFATFDGQIYMRTNMRTNLTNPKMPLESGSDLANLM